MLAYHCRILVFAFARESWVEIAVSKRSSGDDWEIVVHPTEDQPVELTDRGSQIFVDHGITPERHFEALISVIERHLDHLRDGHPVL